MSDLYNFSSKEYHSVPFCGVVRKYELLDIHDGDTVTVGLSLTELNLSLKVRLSGIDTQRIVLM